MVDSERTRLTLYSYPCRLLGPWGFSWLWLRSKQLDSQRLISGVGRTLFREIEAPISVHENNISRPILIRCVLSYNPERHFLCKNPFKLQSLILVDPISHHPDSGSKVPFGQPLARSNRCIVSSMAV